MVGPEARKGRSSAHEEQRRGADGRSAAAYRLASRAPMRGSRRVAQSGSFGFVIIGGGGWFCMRNVPRFGRDLARFWDTADPLLGEPINELEEGSARDGFTSEADALM